MESKQCRQCGKVQPLDNFYLHPKMWDGRLNKCHECIKLNVRRHRERNIDAIRAYDRKRGLSAKRKRANRERYKNRTPEQIAADWAARKDWRAKNKDRRSAHIAVGNAIRDGKLKRKPCERCGTKKRIRAHHEDYTKPLDVIWLCRKCHGERHREINEQNRR